MPNNIPVRLSNLTFASLDVQRSDLGIHLDITYGLNDGLEVRGEDTTVPSLVGRVARNRKRHVRRIGVAGWIQGVGETEATRLASYQDLCDSLEAAFDPSGDPETLSGLARDGSTRSIVARTTSIVWNDEPVPGVSWLAIELASTVPDWDITGGGS